jgi:hypothetical protein
MTKTVLAGMTVGLLMFCTVGSANASPVTLGFTVRIDSIELSNTYDSAAALAVLAPHTGQVGDRLFGSVTYEGSSIPNIGSYRIETTKYAEAIFWADEMQPWTMTWPGLTDWGFEFLPVAAPRAWLEFMDGKPSGIFAEDYPDWSYGVWDQGFRGTDVFAHGRISYAAQTGQQWSVFEPEFRIRGTVQFAVPDPGSTLLLLGMGLVGLRAWRKRL